MRKFVLAAALAGTALSVSACSQDAEDVAEAPADGAMADAGMETTDDAAMMGDTVLDANTATAAQLASVDGMSDELAQAVVAGQPYGSVVNLSATLLETLSPEEAMTVLESVFVPVNLNSASREEIALIPGMTDRMIGEFEEYRPYADMAEFDREIGKYVDEAEVARFRNYVTL